MLKKYTSKNSIYVIFTVVFLSTMVGFLPLGSSADPALKSELQNILFSAEQRKALENNKMGECSQRPCMEDVRNDNLVKILSINVSRSLLKADDKRHIVKVIYKNATGKEIEEYHLFYWSIIGGWRHISKSSQFSYYLNFL